MLCFIFLDYIYISYEKNVITFWYRRNEHFIFTNCKLQYNIFRQKKARNEEKLRLDVANEVPPVAPRTTPVNSSRPGVGRRSVSPLPSLKRQPSRRHLPKFPESKTRPRNNTSHCDNNPQSIRNAPPASSSLRPIQRDIFYENMTAKEKMERLRRLVLERSKVIPVQRQNSSLN